MENKIPSDAIVVQNARLAVKIELQKNRARWQPIAKFDEKTGQVYLEHSDGSSRWASIDTCFYYNADTDRL